MKKGIKILAFMLLAVFFTGCFASNVDLKRYMQENIKE